MIDAEHIIDLAIELANEAIEASHSDPDGKVSYRHWMGKPFYRLVEAVRGIGPGMVELEALCDSIAFRRGDDEKQYVLCDAKTREPLDDSPTAWYIERDIQCSNESVAPFGLVWLETAVVKQEAADRAALEQEASRTWLNRDEIETLVAFADANGRTWKRKLRAAWESGSAGDALQRLRNARCFGPSGLEKFKLPAKVKR